MKKFLSFLLVVAITITCIPSNFVIAQAQTDTEEITSMYQSVPITIDEAQLSTESVDSVTTVKFGRIRAGGATVTWENFKKGDTTKYLTKDTTDATKDYVSTESGADATNYTVKLEWPETADKPTLYLKGAVLGGYSATEKLYGNYNFSNIGDGIAFSGDVIPDVVIEADSTIYSYNTALRFAGTATIKSVNGAKLKIATGGNATNGSIAISAGESLTFDGAVIDMTEYIARAPSIESKDGIDIIIKNGSKIETKSYHRSINAGQGGTTGDIIITDSTVTVAAGGLNAPGLQAKGNITITNSDVTIAPPADAGSNATGVGGEISAGGTVSIAGSDVTITNGRYYGIYGQAGILINGGTVKIAMKENGGFRLFNIMPEYADEDNVIVSVGTNGTVTQEVGPESTAIVHIISFANNENTGEPSNNKNYVEITHPNLGGDANHDITLTVYDENHRDVTNHCTVTWYDETGENVLSVGNVLRQADSALTYSYSIALDNTYGVEYAEPEMQQVSIAGGVYDTSFTLEPLPKTTFSAIVENDLNEAVYGASIRVEQIANERFPKISQAVSDVNGAFSLNILTENVDIYVSAQDHHEKRIQMTADEFFQWMSEDNPVITLEKIRYPEEFSLLNPEDQQRDLDTHLTLQWSDSKWAEYYNVFLWKDGRQQPSTATFKNIVGNSVSVTLENGTKYHAVVCAVNEYGQYNSNEITFTTITGPNLTVSEVHVPTEVYAGSPLSVSWTVKNIGGLSTDSAQWTDTVYITSSESLDYNNILAKVSCDNLSYLNPGESYSNEITVNIPRGTSGKYYAFVVTNQYSDLNDHASVDDMVRSSAINVILPPTPDLTMSEVKTAGIFGAIPGSYSENTAIISDNDLSVKWTVENTGIEVGEDASWTDVIFLRNQDGSKEYNLGQIRITKDQHQNGNYTATKTVHIPEECFGEWSIVVVSDYYNEVYENLKGNNDRSSTLNITLNPPADLKPDNVSIPDNITSGAEFTVSWKDANIGVKSVSGKSWTDKVYISQESTFDVANATLLGTVNNCTADKLLSVTCTLPVAYKGEYYIYIVTDVTKRVFEYETYGNNTAGQAVTVVQGKLADLDIDSITVNGDAYIAENLEITYTVKNIGDGKTSTSLWKDKIYLVDASEGETLLKTVTHNAMVASAGSYTETVTVAIPSTVEEGQYSIRIQTNADEKVLESYTTNNSESSSVFTVNAKRNVALAVTDMQITAGSFVENETVTITYTVENSGTYPAKNVKDVILLSTSAEKPTDSIVLTTKTVAQVNAGEDYTNTVSVVLPSSKIAGGEYYLFVVTNYGNAIGEADYEDNYKCTYQTNPDHVYIRALSDLTVTQISAPESVQAGQTVDITYTVKNNSQSATYESSWIDYIYLTTYSGVYNPNVVFIVKPNIAIYSLKSERILGSLSGNGEYQRTVSVTIPNGIGGSYRFVVVSDVNNVNRESNRLNNQLSTEQINVARSHYADLKAEIISISENAVSGQPIEVTYKITNEGEARAAGSWNDVLYYSIGNVSNKALITSGNIRELGVGESYTSTCTISIPSGLSGLCTLKLESNKNLRLYETNTANNTDSKVFAVSPLPHCELKVANVKAPATAVPGTNVTVSWDVINLSTTPLNAVVVDNIYISAGNTWDSSAILVSRYERNLQLEGSATDYSSVDFEMLDYETLSKLTEQATGKLPGVESGQYYILIRTDVNNQVAEENEDDNAGASEAVNVSVRNVYIGTPFVSSVSSYGEEYCKFYTDAGKALYISLDSVTANSKMELYVKAGGTPSATEYDYKYSNVSQSGVGFAIPSTVEGEYYIYIRNIDGTSVTNYTLNITEMNFGIKHISPEIGGQGKTTIKLTGALFEANAKVYLENGTTSVQAEEIYFVDSSNMYATFDLTYAELGKYNLKVVCGDKTSVLENGYEIKKLPKGELEVTVSINSSITVGSVRSGTITYKNSGYTDIYAPILFVQGENFTFKPADSDSYVSNDLFFAANQTGLAGTLAHGEGGSYNFTFKANTTGEYILNVYNYADFEPEAEDTTELTADSSIADIMVDSIRRLIGEDCEDYAESIAKMATYLQQFGNEDTAIAFLEGAYYDNALASLMGTAITSTTDITSRELALSRTFSNDIADKNTVGMFGKGWLNNLEVEAVYTAEEDDEYILMSLSSGSLLFTKNDAGVFAESVYGMATAEYIGGKITVSSADGSQYRFNEDGKITEYTDVLGNKTGFTYTNGLLTQVEANGDILTLEYTDGKVTKAFSANDTVTYTYNGDYLTSVTTKYGTVSYTYNTEAIGANRGTLTKITYANGTSQHFEYDSIGRITATYYDDGVDKLTYLYDGINQITTVDSNGYSVTDYYDAYGQVVRSVDADGNIQKITYNDDFMVESISYGTSMTVAYGYDADFNVTDITSPDGHATRYTYDAFGNITSITDKRGIVTTYERDEFGNSTKLVYADGSAESYAYDGKGNVTSYTDRSGKTVTYAYDEHDNLILVTYADGSTVSYAYDARGNTTEVNEDGEITTLAYDEKGDLIKITYPDGKTVNYTYDEYGRTLSITDGDGDGSFYTYDKYGRLSTLSSKDKVEVSYFYNLDSSLRKTVNSNGTSTEYTYKGGNISSIYNYGADGEAMSYFEYTYDTMGYISSMKTEEGTWYYAYDLNGQLVKATSPDGKVTTYTYDLSGNKVSVTEDGVETKYTANRLNQYTNVGDNEFTYDANGNMTSMTDKNGVVTTYSYDNENRLISVEVAGGAATTYGYDAFGLRNSVTVDGETTAYLNTPGGDGYALSSVSGAEKTVYLLGNGIEGLQKNGNSYFYSTNHLGSVVDITDSTGATVNSYAYDQDGLVTGKTEGITNPYTYVGRYGIGDDGNGLYYMRARYVSQITGAFTTVDPLGQWADLNVYRYAGNNTVMLVDTSGKVPAILIGAGIIIGIGIIGGITGGITQAILDRNYADYNFWGSFREGFVKGAAVGAGIGALISLGALVGYGISLLPASAISPAALAAAIGNALKALRPVAKAMKVSKPRFSKVAGFLPFVLPAVFSPKASASGNAVASADPNDILGPDGYGDAKWIRADETLSYTVRFENDPVFATAPVQKLTVTQTLDENLDIRSFRLVSFGFGENTFTVPENTSLYQTRLDMRETLGIYIDVFAGIDVINKTVSYTFTAIDPATGQIPNDPFTGFLPINDENHIGEGFITYTVNPKEDVTTGTVIKAMADIVFDNNEAIATPEIFNTVDADNPESSLTEAVKTAEDKIKLSWTSSDGENQSGIGAVDIYASENNGAWKLIKSGVISDTEYVDAEDGVLYSFIVRASDNAGNVEAWNETAQRTVDNGYIATPPAAPEISELSHSAENAVITITAEAGCTVYYTLDGTDPTTASAKYSGMLTVPVGTTVKAMAYSAEKVASDVTAFTPAHTPGTPADCTHDQLCTVCSAVLDERNGHTPGAPADCTHDQTCTVCSAVLDERNGHTPGTPADCTHDQLCTVCSAVLDERNGHTPGAPADCTHDQLCTVCSAVLDERNGHTPGAPADCTHDQLCTVCSAVLDERNGHTPGTPADCTHDQLCTICSAVIDEKLGHNYEAVVTPPTLAEQGYTTHTCSRCSDSYIDTYVSAVLLGDFNANGEVTSDDALYLLWYTFQPEEYPLNQNGDLNGDGSITSDDAVYLLWFTFQPEEYPLDRP